MGGPEVLDAARAVCAYQHNQTDLEYQSEPTQVEFPNIVPRAGFMDYTDDDCMS